MMRPRKQIIVCADNMADADNLTYVLSIRGHYEPWSILDVPNTPLPKFPALIIVVSRICYDAPEASFRVIRRFPDCPILYISYWPVSERQFDIYIQSHQKLASPPMELLMETITIMSTRKRGPKKIEQIAAIA